jgi:hypothetical protein
MPNFINEELGGTLMILSYSKSINKKIITIELSTTSFTTDENKALDNYGEPEIKFEKLYNNTYPVAFTKKIRTGFKVKIKFDGTEDIESATESANAFFEEIQETLANSMTTLMDEATGTDFSTESGMIDIQY